MPAQPRFHVSFQGDGYTIKATWFDGRCETLVGVFNARADAQEWLDAGGGKRWLEQYMAKTGATPHLNG